MASVEFHQRYSRPRLFSVEEFRHAGNRAQRRQIFHIRQLRSIPLVYFTRQRKPNASPAFAETGARSRARWRRDRGSGPPGFFADEACPAPAQDHDRVDMLVSLQCGETARLDFEVAQFSREVRIGKQDLSRDRLERRAALFLVVQPLHARPAKVIQASRKPWRSSPNIALIRKSRFRPRARRRGSRPRVYRARREEIAAD